MVLAKAAVLLVCISLSCAAQTDTPDTAPASQVKTIAAIGQDIANLKAKFPQLREFSVSKNVLSQRLIITYDYHTHRSQIPGGWRAQVPEPDDDGVWLYIDFHDPASTDQIHTTRPTWPGWWPDCFEDKKVSFWMRDGDNTSSALGEIEKILERHGVKPCTAPASQVKTIVAIGQDIAKLKAKFPQLREFSVSKNVLSEWLIIDYDYHTHRSHFREDWELPRPDDDGVWFLIDFHDPDSEIDTQPGDPQDCFEDKKVWVRMREGDKTSSVLGEIRKILEQHGVKPCADRTP